ncbi:MAG TPA: biotin/lipoyl-binding protein, partial [Candidatus Krumholzibacterium sp.]|nr:biotin/lipoyl-binding protein [Candidatus Krumholzibacterium sp.]
MLSHRFFVLFLLFALLAGCGDGKTQEASTEPAREAATNVVVETLVPQDLEERFTLPGTLEGWNEIVLAAEAGGAVRSIRVAEGQRVEKGEVILEIDPDTRRANLARAEAEYALRKKKAQRYENLIAE